MPRRLAPIALAIALAACRSKPAAPVETALPLETIVAKALPSVVLLVRYQADGTIGFGAGILIDDRGLVLTNLHVIDHGVALSGLLHDPKRPTYTVLEGGLKRFLFEQQQHLITAKEERRDEALDLALVRLAANTGDRPRLSLSARALSPGEPVVAVGHPGEMLWSFTTGVVSALPDRMIQHDALVSPGSSGGPLLDRRGEVVGIDTAMVKGARGAGFARPAALARGFLDEVTPPDATVDLSTPERATETCLRALERQLEADCGSSATDAVWNLETEEEKKPLPLGVLGPWNGIPIEYLLYVATGRWLNSSDAPLPTIVRCTTGERLCSAAPNMLSPEAQRGVRDAIAALPAADRERLLGAARAVKKRADAALAAQAQRLREETGFASWRRRELRERLRGGYRIGKVQRSKTEDGDEIAWILVEGRTTRDESYAFSTMREQSRANGLHVVQGDKNDTKLLLQLGTPEGWAERVPTPKQAVERPKGWPPPLGDTETSSRQFEAAIAGTLLELSEPTSTHN